MKNLIPSFLRRSIARALRYRKIGGLHFFRIGKLQISFCVPTGKPKRQRRKVITLPELPPLSDFRLPDFAQNPNPPKIRYCAKCGANCGRYLTRCGECSGVVITTFN